MNEKLKVKICGIRWVYKKEIGVWSARSKVEDGGWRKECGRKETVRNRYEFIMGCGTRGSQWGKGVCMKKKGFFRWRSSSCDLGGKSCPLEERDGRFIYVYNIKIYCEILPFFIVFYENFSKQTFEKHIEMDIKLNSIK